MASTTSTYREKLNTTMLPHEYRGAIAHRQNMVRHNDCNTFHDHCLNTHFITDRDVTLSQLSVSERGRERERTRDRKTEFEVSEKDKII